MMHISQTEWVLQLARELSRGSKVLADLNRASRGEVAQRLLTPYLGTVRPRDLKAHSIPHEYLQRLYERGALVRSGRGIYVLADAELSENFSLAEACKRFRTARNRCAIQTPSALTPEYYDNAETP